MKQFYYLLLFVWFWSMPCLLSAQELSPESRSGVWEGNMIHYHPGSFLVQKHKGQDISTARDGINTLPIDIKAIEYLAYDWFLVSVQQEIELERIAELAQRY